MTARLTAEEEAAIRERERFATSGPWAWESVGEKENSWCVGVVDPPQTGEVIENYDEASGKYNDKPIVVEFICENGSDGTFADAAFIAHARQDVTSLLDELDALRANKATLSSAIFAIAKSADGGHSFELTLTNMLRATSAAIDVVGRNGAGNAD